MNKLFYGFLLLALLASCKQDDNRSETTEAKSETVEKRNVASIYEIGGRWTDQNNENVLLEDHKGKVQVVTMVFTHCPYACPRIVGDLQAIEEKIPADKKDEVHFLLVSFDTERDTPARLTEFYKEMGMNKNWTLLHGNEDDVRSLSVLLNVQYEKVENGDFAHSNNIVVLDRNGGIQFQQEGLGKDPAEAVKVINSLLANK